MKVDIIDTIKSRVGDVVRVEDSSAKEKAQLRYRQLKEEIKARTLEEVVNKLELAKALYEIKKINYTYLMGMIIF
ncbi:Putative plasmid partition protein, partial (plasmid) [Borrelia anserina BA2]